MIAKTKKLQKKSGRGLHLPIIELPPSRYLYVPVDNTRSKSSDISIQPGDHVYKGQRIGQRHAAFFDQPIFAVVSGTYVGLEKRLYRNNKVIDWIKIENDFKEEVDPAHVERDQAAMDALNKEEAAMLNRYYSAVGLGGSSFPTYIKMNMPNKINTILLNGIECEPYLCADYLAIQNESETIIEAMKFLKRIYECHDIRLCVKPNHPELESIFLRALQKNPDPEIRFQFVKDYYPQGWEIAMIKEATGIQVAPGHLPGEYGIANFNVNTAIQIYNNCKHDMPMLDRYVTVQGDAIVSPCTIRCRVGTPYAELIAAAGGYKDDPREKTLILGGPMMGASVSDDTGITTRTVTSLIVDYKEEYVEQPCIRCGSCVLSCPMDLRPVDIMLAMKVSPVDKDRVKALKPLNCMECGLCTYSCTSKIKLLDYIRRAKPFAKLP